MDWKDALKVGLVQCLAMIPGTSRSGATIIGAMLLGLSRRAATDFSFYLAIPTLIGAGAYSLYKERALLTVADLPMFTVGLLFSFISAWLCVRWLLRYISTHSFTPFAWYRIAFGIVVLATSATGWVSLGAAERARQLAFGLGQAIDDDAQHLRVGHHAQVAGRDLDAFRALGFLLDAAAPGDDAVGLAVDRGRGHRRAFAQPRLELGRADAPCPCSAV